MAAVLTENEIRPAALAAGQEAAFAADIARLMARRDAFIPVACPACNAADARPHCRKSGMQFVTCRACATIYANPRPTPALLDEYYATSANYAYFNQFIFPASEDVRRERIFRPRLARLVALMEHYPVGPAATLLEVGAGFGTFCTEARASGRFERVIGVEPTPDLAATCRQRGIEILATPIERLPAGAIAADVVAAFEVIEHLFAPRRFVQACAQFLGPGGLLVLTCPNGQGFEIEALAEQADAVDVEHLNLFNRGSLTALLECCGFDVLEVTTPGGLDAELVHNQVVAGRHALAGQPFLRRVLLDEWERLGPPFQQFLAEHGLSSHMWAAARRR